MQEVEPNFTAVHKLFSRPYWHEQIVQKQPFSSVPFAKVPPTIYNIACFYYNFHHVSKTSNVTLPHHLIDLTIF